MNAIERRSTGVFIEGLLACRLLPPHLEHLDHLRAKARTGLTSSNPWRALWRVYSPSPEFIRLRALWRVQGFELVKPVRAFALRGSRCSLECLVDSLASGGRGESACSLGGRYTPRTHHCPGLHTARTSRDTCRPRPARPARSRTRRKPSGSGPFVGHRRLPFSACELLRIENNGRLRARGGAAAGRCRDGCPGCAAAPAGPRVRCRLLGSGRHVAMLSRKPARDSGPCSDTRHRGPTGGKSMSAGPRKQRRSARRIFTPSTKARRPRPHLPAMPRLGPACRPPPAPGAATGAPQPSRGPAPGPAGGRGLRGGRAPRRRATRLRPSLPQARASRLRPVHGKHLCGFSYAF